MAKGNWKYIQSETLDQKLAYDLNSGWLFCQDGTRYTPQEIKLLTNAKAEIPLAVHLIKKEFTGEIISVTNTEKK